MATQHPPSRRALRTGPLTAYGGSALLVLAAVLVTLQFVKPAPPDHIRIAAGPSSGAYFHYAQAYARALAREGVRLEVLESAGSRENLDLLQDADGGVDLAIVQGGIPLPADSENLQSLGSLFLEPIWILGPSGSPDLPLNQLVGKRIGVGPLGSGTLPVALRLLSANGVTDDNATLVSEPLEQSAGELLAGRLDALFLVAAPDSPLLRRLVESGKVQVEDLERSPAYARIDPNLSALSLPRGTLDLARDIPPRDTRLVGAAAGLISRTDLHPALVDLLLMAAAEVHGPGGLFAKPGAFPAPTGTELPLSPDAERHYENGPPFLQRYMPFWAANLVDRLKIMLLPLIGLLFPLVKVMPPVVRWRIRSRIYRWYSQLRAIDQATGSSPGAAERDRMHAELERIETEVRQIDVPLSYTDQVYNLRLHIQLIRDQLEVAAPGPDTNG